MMCYIRDRKLTQGGARTKKPLLLSMRLVWTVSLRSQDGEEGRNVRNVFLGTKAFQGVKL